MLAVQTLSWSSVAQESPSALSGFQPEEIFDIQDGGEIERTEPILQRLISRCFQISEKSLAIFVQQTKAVSLTDVVAEPRDFRFYSFEMEGIATEFETYAIESDDRPYTGIHVLRVLVDGENELVLVLPQEQDEQTSIPVIWNVRTEFHQPIRFSGFFMGLRNFEEDDDVPGPRSLKKRIGVPVFVARKLSWFPEQVSKSLSISTLDVLLAGRGVDYNLFQQVGEVPSSGIGSSEAISFYQLLKATTQIESFKFGTASLALEEMLRDPKGCLGQPVNLAGHVRRVTEIPIDDPFVRNQLGLEKYFQLDMFVQLGDRKIVIKPPRERSSASRNLDDNHGLIIENRFPITVCTCELPAPKEMINRNRLLIRGVFFKNWSYESELSIENRTGVQQIAPLIIASKPELSPLSPDYFGWLLSAFSVAVLALTILLAWLWRPGQGSEHKRNVPDQIEVPDIY